MDQSVLFDETKIFDLPTDQVIISADLPRRRKDLGEIEKMMASIKQFGQLQPIVINRKNELIYGGRRLAACTLLNIPIKACYKDTLDPILMRELEIEENIQRKAFTPAEECLAIEELVAMKQAKYGVPVQGQKGGYTLDNAADAIGKTKGTVIEALNIADMLKAFPNLSEAKTKSEIKKTYKGLQRVQQNITALSSYEKKIEDSDPFTLTNSAAKDFLASLKDQSIDFLFTDPPYGIDINETAMTVGGVTAGENTTTGIKYEDKFEKIKPVLLNLIQESYRITKDNGHAVFFCGKDRFIFQFMHDEMAKAGWDVMGWPIIWIKQSSGQNNQPDNWPSSAYEAMLFARKPLSRIKVPGKPDWIQCNIVPSSHRVHPAEKPTALCRDIISRFTIAGQLLCDPFMGSGALIEAACQMKLICSGNEKATESYALAVNRMIEWKKEKTNVN